MENVRSRMKWQRAFLPDFQQWLFVQQGYLISPDQFDRFRAPDRNRHITRSGTIFYIDVECFSYKVEREMKELSEGTMETILSGLRRLLNALARAVNIPSASCYGWNRPFAVSLHTTNLLPLLFFQWFEYWMKSLLVIQSHSSGPSNTYGWMQRNRTRWISTGV